MRHRCRPRYYSIFGTGAVESSRGHRFVQCSLIHVIVLTEDHAARRALNDVSWRKGASASVSPTSKRRLGANSSLRLRQARAKLESTHIYNEAPKQRTSPSVEKSSRHLHQGVNPPSSSPHLTFSPPSCYFSPPLATYPLHCNRDFANPLHWKLITEQACSPCPPPLRPTRCS